MSAAVEKVSVLNGVVLTASELAAYQAGYEHGVTEGRRQVDEELAAEWEAIKPIARQTVVMMGTQTARERARAAIESVPAWDPDAERERCRSDWGVAS